MWVKPQQYAALGALLAAKRREAGVTQDDLAERLQKPQSFISTYEHGQRRVDILELLVILKALGVEPQPVLLTIIDEIGEGANTDDSE